MYNDLIYLDVAIEEHVAVVHLNGPVRGNAYTARGHAEMSEIFRRLERDDAVWAVVITGAGDSFSIGPDREFAASLNGDSVAARKAMAESQAIVLSAFDCCKPIVAAVNGRVFGGALIFALAADIVIVERHVSLCDSHVPAALVAGDGGVLFWPMAMGLLRAKRYLLTGDPLTADEAERLGLITEAVDEGKSLSRAMQYASRFVAGPQPAIRETKRALNSLVHGAPLSAFALSAALEATTLADPEAAHAMADLMHGGSGAMPPDVPH